MALSITSASVASDGRSLTVNVGGITSSPLLPASGVTGFTINNTTQGFLQQLTGVVGASTTVTANLPYVVYPGDVLTLTYGSVFTVTLGGATGGTFTLTFNGHTTAGIAFGASPTTVATAVAGLGGVGVNNVVGSGSAGNITLTFSSQWIGSTAALTGNGASLTGSTGLSIQVGNLTDTFTVQMPIQSVSVTNNSTLVAPSLTNIANADFSSLPGLKAWYVASFGTFKDTGAVTPATADGDKVALLQNKISVGSFDMIQATGANQPVLKLTTNGINNLPTIHFTAGSTTSLVATALIASDMAQGYTIWVVGIPKAAGSTMAAWSVVAAAQPFQLVYPNNTVSVTNTLIDLTAGAGLYGNAGVTLSRYGSNSVITTDGTLNATMVSQDGTNLTFSSNRHERSAGNPNVIPTGNFAMGIAGSNKLTGDIAEIIVCNCALSSSVRHAVENALMVKYGITQVRAVNFLGDSIVVTPAENTAYAQQATSALTNLFYNDNQALSGQPVYQILTKLPTQAISTANTNRLRLIADLEGGTNDIVGGSTASIPNTTAGGDLLYAQFVAVCRILRATGYRVNVHTILPRKGQSTARRQFNTNVQTNWPTFADGLVDAAVDTLIGDNLSAGSDTQNNNFLLAETGNTGYTAGATATLTFATVQNVAPFAAGDNMNFTGGTQETLVVLSCSTTSVTFTANVANASHSSMYKIIQLLTATVGTNNATFVTTQTTAPYRAGQSVTTIGGTVETLIVSSCTTTSVTFTTNIANASHTALKDVMLYTTDNVHLTVAGGAFMAGYVNQAIQGGAAYRQGAAQAGIDNSLFGGILSVASQTSTAINLTWTAATGGTGPYTYQVMNAPNVVSNGFIYISAASNTSPIVITTPVHQFNSGDTVVVTGVGGNTGANGTWVANVIDNLTISLTGSVGNGAYTTGGTVARDFYNTPGTFANLGASQSGTTFTDSSPSSQNWYQVQATDSTGGTALINYTNMIAANLSSGYINLERFPPRGVERGVYAS